MAKPIPVESFRGTKKSLTLSGKTFPIGPQSSSFKPAPGSGVINLTAGSVFEGFDCRGRDVVVGGDNVTIRNCLMNATGYWSINNTQGKRGLVVEFCMIDGEKRNNQNAAMVQSEAGDTTFRNNVCLYAPTDMLIMCGGLAEHNVFAGSYYQQGAHADAFSIAKSVAPMVFRENYIDFTKQPDSIESGNSCLKIVSHFGPIDNVLVENNIILGGGYNVYCGASPHPVNNVRFINNAYGLSGYGTGSPEGFIVGGGKSPDNGSNFVNSGNFQFSTAPDGIVALSGTQQPTTPTLPPVTPPTPNLGPPKCVEIPVIDHGGVGERASTMSGKWENLGNDSTFKWQWFLNGKPQASATHELIPTEPGKLELVLSVNTPTRGSTAVVANPVDIPGAEPVPPPPIEPPPVVVPPPPTTPTGLTLSDADVLEIKTALVTIARKIGAP